MQMLGETSKVRFHIGPRSAALDPTHKRQKRPVLAIVEPRDRARQRVAAEPFDEAERQPQLRRNWVVAGKPFGRDADHGQRLAVHLQHRSEQIGVAVVPHADVSPAVEHAMHRQDAVGRNEVLHQPRVRAARCFRGTSDG